MPKHLLFTLIIPLLFACGTKTSEPRHSTATLTFHWEPQPGVCNAHLRGLDLVGDSIIWASGTEGTVIRSTDGGLTWWTVPVPEADSLDFRDIEAFDDLNAIAMSSGRGVSIYRTSDGGAHWALAYKDLRPEVFFDGIAFSDPAHGLAYADPLDGAFLCIATTDSGNTWTPLDPGPFPPALDNEAGFAASGTGIAAKAGHRWIATGGGNKARVIHSRDGHTWKAAVTPLRSGKSAGIFSICFWDTQNGVIAGGDYIDSARAGSNAAYTEDGGQTWQPASIPPSGYRSCVAANSDGSLLITTGEASDYSTDGGRTWKKFSDAGYHSCVIGVKTAWGVGSNGKMGRMSVP